MSEAFAYPDDGVVSDDGSRIVFDLPVWQTSHDPPRINEIFPRDGRFLRLTSELAPDEFTYAVVGPIESFASTAPKPVLGDGFSKTEFKPIISRNFRQDAPGQFKRRRDHAGQ